MPRPPPRSTLFPYTTLFRSVYNLAVVSAASAFGIDDVYAAARRLRDRIHRTPTIASQSFDDASGYRVFLKCENLQRAGSFKIRGALNKLRSLPDADRARGVVAYSSGNHAQGVALAARMVGSSAIICMPTDAPALKVGATRRYGAEIVFYDRMKDDRAALAARIASEPGRVLVPPYDDYAIMAGLGSAALGSFGGVRGFGAPPLPRAALVGVARSGGTIDPNFLAPSLKPDGDHRRGPPSPPPMI